MTGFVPYYRFLQDFGREVHNFQTESFKIALTNRPPVVASDVALSDIGEIAPGAGYAAGGMALTGTSWTQSGGSGLFAANDVQLLTSGSGAVGPFRYCVLYNASQSDLLVGYWDRGSPLALTAPADSFSILWNPTNQVLKLIVPEQG